MCTLNNIMHAQIIVMIDFANKVYNLTFCKKKK